MKKGECGERGMSQKMDIRGILKQVDVFYEENRGEQAEKLMQESILQAVQEQDDESLLQLLNELLGYYRETSQTENAHRIGEQAIAQAVRMGLEGTFPYATTMLNVANARRAAGELQESLEYYLQVQALYKKLLTPDNIFIAGLENNMSLLYQEMGEYAKAKQCQLKALEIVRGKETVYEQGVTCANLAASCVRLGELEEAKKYAEESLRIFQDIQVADSHFGAALAALGDYHFQKEEFASALERYRQAMEAVEQGIGRNEAFYRLQERVSACEKALTRKEKEGKAEPENSAVSPGALEEDAAKADQGLVISRKYYETCGKTMIAEKFPEYEGKIAIGLVGRGSDCFGYDDKISRDHDWGPDFCMWMTEETYREIGQALQKAYDELPEEFMGYKRAPHVNGRSRRGALCISEFYRGLVGAGVYEDIDWKQAPDYGLAAAVNGKVFRDDEGIFTEYRSRLQQGYPEQILYLKLAESAARFAQSAQYNYFRMLEREDRVTAQMMLWAGIREAMKLQHYLEGRFPPHDKWLLRSLQESQEGREITALLKQIQEAAEDESRVRELIKQLGAHFAMELYGRDLISDIDPYLDAHSEELMYKASLAEKADEDLVEEIAKLEFQAFDKVKNEGGRASCQNDWFTFSIMRKSQYLTWNRTMLLQYLYDFHREFSLGHNLIEEKYGRMMESTAPEEYEKIKGHFPELTEEKRNIIGQICSMQVKWMEEFAEEYPALADNARSIHTYEDNPFDTSYETYLRGELGTYSDKMLELYGRYVVEYARSGKNPAYDIMGNSVRMYGYGSLEEAEQKNREAWS